LDALITTAALSQAVRVVAGPMDAARRPGIGSGLAERRGQQRAFAKDWFSQYDVKRTDAVTRHHHQAVFAHGAVVADFAPRQKGQ